MPTSRSDAEITGSVFDSNQPFWNAAASLVLLYIKSSVLCTIFTLFENLPRCNLNYGQPS